VKSGCAPNKERTQETDIAPSNDIAGSKKLSS
jgi:hypothetical protein